MYDKRRIYPTNNFAMVDVKDNTVKLTWINRHGVDILRISIAIVFLWFGFLKYFDATAAADEIAIQTISKITFGLLTKEISLPFLATLEFIIGIGLLFKLATKYIIPLLYFQMAGAILPLFLFPNETWSSFFVPTLLGQYIIKNFIIVSAAIVVSVVAKGGKLITDPTIAKEAAIIESKNVQ